MRVRCLVAPATIRLAVEIELLEAGGRLVHDTGDRSGAAGQRITVLALLGQMIRAKAFVSASELLALPCAVGRVEPATGANGGRVHADSTKTMARTIAATFMIITKRSSGRAANYEAILRILNDCLQSHVEGLPFVFAGTDECLLCKPHKMNKATNGERRRPLRARISERRGPNRTCGTRLCATRASSVPILRLSAFAACSYVSSSSMRRLLGLRCLRHRTDLGRELLHVIRDLLQERPLFQRHRGCSFHLRVYAFRRMALHHLSAANLSRCRYRTWCRSRARGTARDRCRRARSCRSRCSSNKHAPSVSYPHTG